MSDFTDTIDLKAKRYSNSWNKSSIDLSSNLLNNYHRDKKHKKRSSSISSINSSSTLSLHIAAYENLREVASNSDADKNENLKKKNLKLGLNMKCKNPKRTLTGLPSSFPNPFEFPRQQENQSNHPEVMQFKASQRLLNPNQMNANNEAMQNGVSTAETVNQVPTTNSSLLAGGDSQPQTPPVTLAKSQAKKDQKYIFLMEVAEGIVEIPNITREIFKEEFIKQCEIQSKVRNISGSSFYGSWVLHERSVERRFKLNYDQFENEHDRRFARIQQRFDRKYCVTDPVTPLPNDESNIYRKIFNTTRRDGASSIGRSRTVVRHSADYSPLDSQKTRNRTAAKPFTTNFEIPSPSKNVAANLQSRLHIPQFQKYMNKSPGINVIRHMPPSFRYHSRNSPYYSNFSSSGGRNSNLKRFFKKESRIVRPEDEIVLGDSDDDDYIKHKEPNSDQNMQSDGNDLSMHDDHDDIEYAQNGIDKATASAEETASIPGEGPPTNSSPISSATTENKEDNELQPVQHQQQSTEETDTATKLPTNSPTKSYINPKEPPQIHQQSPLIPPPQITPSRPQVAALLEYFNRCANILEQQYELEKNV
uniref:Uncharacterized protein n=1 Tax=Panagrolaimus sp. ES5 TaxID=591445 RepID=A0AC34F2G6_9BILA